MWWRVRVWGQVNHDGSGDRLGFEFCLDLGQRGVFANIFEATGIQRGRAVSEPHIFVAVHDEFFLGRLPYRHIMLFPVAVMVRAPDFGKSRIPEIG